MNIKELQTLLSAKLGGGKYVANDARQILMFVTKMSHAELIANNNKHVSKFKKLKALMLAKARANGKPMAYIFKSRDFFGRRFTVNKHVLIPRPETEIMVEKALELKNNDTVFIDIGTGSGAIAITLALESHSQVIATDISKNALKVAKRNAHLLKAKVNFYAGNLLEPIWPNELKHERIVITANLPYLSKSMLDSSPNEVRNHEPKIALVSDNTDGLDLYRELLQQIKTRKNEFQNELFLLLEIDPRQAKIANSTFQKLVPNATVKIKNDLAGKPRVVVIQY